MNNEKIRIFRKKIDAIDAEIVEKLNERAKLAQRIGDEKRKRGIPVYDAKREDKVFEKVNNLSSGPFKGKILKDVYMAIMTGSRELEEGKEVDV